MFTGWPTERIANIHYDEVESDTSVCSKFYRLTRREVDWVFPLSLGFEFHRALKERKTRKGLSMAKSQPITTPQTGYVAGWLARAYRAVLAVLGGEALHSSVQLTSELCTWIEKFKPDLIYSSLGDLIFLRLTRLIAESYELPTVVHTYDNWPESRYRHGLFAPIFRYAFLREYENAFQRARLCFGISDAMSRDYEKRYGKRFLTFNAPVDIEQWSKHAKSNWVAAGAFRVVYIGSIHPHGQRESLVEIAQAVSCLHNKSVPITLHIYTPVLYVADLERRIANMVGVKVTVSPPSPEVAQVLASADALVLPVNFDRESQRVMRYSLPAKTAAYLISSVPVLVYGPPGLPPVEYAASEQWGLVVSEQSTTALREALCQLMSDESLRKRLALRARAVAVKNHNAVEVRAWFQRLLREMKSPTYVSPSQQEDT